MDFAIKFAFDILAFTSVMVLIVLGLGVIASMMGIFNFAHGEFVLLGAYTVYLVRRAAGLCTWSGILAAPIVRGVWSGWCSNALIIRRFYAVPIIAMLGTYAIGLIIREIVRGLLGGHYKSIPEPISGAFTRGGHRFLDLAHLHHRNHAGRDRRQLAAPRPHLDRTADPRRLENPMLARACGISTARLYALDLRLRRRACRPRRRADRAALSALRRYRHPLSGAGLPVGDAWRRRHIRGAGARRQLQSAPWRPGLPWIVIPVLADPLVFVIALADREAPAAGFHRDRPMSCREVNQGSV